MAGRCVIDYLNLTDFFTAGLGFDVAGALLLARGLIADPTELNRISGAFYGSNPYQAVSRARDRLDARSGLLALGLGFLLQAVGYFAILAGISSSDTGTGEVVVAGAALTAAFVLALLAAALYRRWRLVPLLVEMSRRTLDGQRTQYPSASLLPDRLRAYGLKQQVGEDDLAFVRRTAGVQDMTVQVASLPGSDEPRTRLASEPPLEGEVP